MAIKNVQPPEKNFAIKILLTRKMTYHAIYWTRNEGDLTLYWIEAKGIHSPDLKIVRSLLCNISNLITAYKHRTLQRVMVATNEKINVTGQEKRHFM